MNRITSHRALVNLAGLVLALAATQPALVRAQASEPLGSATFKASADHPFGWRGDGTGRFPGATPPTVFGREHKGGGDYETKNIKWMTRLPSYSIGSPVIVGDKVFVATEMTGVVCLNKADGKILWIRHNTYFEAATPEEKQAAPELVKEGEDLSAQLKKMTDEFIAAYNTGVSPQGMSAAAVKATDARYEEYLKLERKLVDVGLKLKGWKHLPDKQHCGWTTATACTDGQRLYVQHGTGVFGCFDLAGNRIWSQAIFCEWEHGNHCSPVLVGDKLVLLLNISSKAIVYGVEKATGKILWQTNATGGAAGSLIATKVGDTDVVIESTGEVFRVSDGKSLFRVGKFPAAWPSGVVDGGVFYDVVNAMHLGRYGQTDIVGTRLPAADGGACAKVFSTQIWDDKKQEQSKIFVSSPLYHDGLLYAISEGAVLVVTDAADGKVVYKKTLDANPLSGGYVGTPGCCACITLGGKYLFIVSDLGIVYVLEPGREYKQVARNVLANIATRWAPELAMKGKQEQTLSNPVFEGKCMFLRGAEYVYCIGGE